MENDIIIFDRGLKRKQRERSSHIISSHDMVIKEAAARLIEHVEDLSKEFPAALDLGGRGYISELLSERFGIKTLIRSDSAFGMLKNAEGLRVVADEELPSFAPDSFDLIISLLNLHWVNDLPGSLIQLKESLRKDGLFVASMLGGETLKELREALVEAEISITGGAAPRISPFADIRGGAALLQRAGFAIPVASSEKITVFYDDVTTLLHDLRGMAETNCLMKRQKTIPSKKLFAKAEEIYRHKYGSSLPATFEIITLSGSKN